MFTYAHVKWFYGQSERAYYLNYFIKCNSVKLLANKRPQLWPSYGKSYFQQTRISL